MRKLLFLALVLITSHAFAQDASSEMPDLTFIVPIQIGTDTLKNGIDTVKLTEETITEMNMALADSNYVVMLTPRGDLSPVCLAKTKPLYFIVKGNTDVLGNTMIKRLFDYVLFAKQKRPMMPAPRHPSMPKQQ